MPPAKIQLKHPDPAKSAPRISAHKYDLVKTALLSVIPADAPGVRFSDLPALVEARLTPEEIHLIGSIAWYVTTVKLDLEARGDIGRVPGASPQRLRRNWPTIAEEQRNDE
jgi:hypothetical protein